MSTNMLLRRDELVKLVALCDQFDTNLVEVIYNEGGGIGYTLDAVIATTINNTLGEFKVEITGVENW